ncbi:MAG: hypothetical protein KAI47_09870 [Deltaproteobacteria bacterium]|nr:hypothetical protein [Deltaproteobacteria bacterium]
MKQAVDTDIAAEVADFERKLDRLRVTYEQYFMGIEKRAPMVQLKDVVRIMRKLDNEKIKNTAMRYRLRTLIQKYNTYRNYWNRTTRAIEAGTYHRDVARVRRKMKRKGIDMPALGKLRSAGDVERAFSEAAKKERELEKEKKKRLSASEIRGRPAEQLSPRRALDGGNTNEWDSAINTWEPDLDEDTEPGTPSPFANAATGPQHRDATPPPAAAASSPPPIPLDSSGSGGLDDLASQAGGPASTQDRSNPSSQRPRRRAGATSRPQASPPQASPPQASPPPPRPSPAAGLPKEKMDSLYRRYQRAKKMCGEDPGSVRYDSLVKTIQRQMPKIREMHPGREVDFQVVIRNGRAILKAKPK